MKPLTRTIRYDGPESSIDPMKGQFEAGASMPEYSGNNKTLPNKLLDLMPKANVSQYTPHEGQTDSRPYEMASGKNVYDGAVAFGDRSVPLGTLIKMGDKKYTVEDRMHARFNETIDPKEYPVYKDKKKKILDYYTQNTINGRENGVPMDLREQHIDILNTDKSKQGIQNARQFGRRHLPFEVLGHDGRSSMKDQTVSNSPNKLNLRDLLASSIKGYIK